MFRWKRSRPASSVDAYTTHIAPLVTAVMQTDGPVLELGCGDTSTPVLHAICAAQRRPLLSADTDEAFISRFANLRSEMHTFKFVPAYVRRSPDNPDGSAWDSVGQETPDGRWSVVFVDHRPGERRREDIARFADRADIVVVHDTEEASYGYEPVLSRFRFRHDDTRLTPWTSLVSNRVDVAALFP